MVQAPGRLWSNPFGNALVNNQGTGVTNAGRGLPFWLNAPRANNVVQYQTPTFSGFFAPLGANGEATARLTLPAGAIPPAMIGLSSMRLSTTSAPMPLGP